MRSASRCTGWTGPVSDSFVFFAVMLHAQIIANHLGIQYAF
jgi:hypothetical protein